MSELELSKESLKGKPEYEIIVARHADYNGYDAEGVPEEQLGWLTEKGIEQSRQLAKNVLDKARESGKPVDILVINSPTAYEDNTGKLLGRRAEQTAVVLMEEIKKLEEDLPPDSVRLLGPGAGDGPIGALFHKELTEPNIHYIADAENPRAYFQAQVEKFGMRPDSASGNLGRKEGYLRGDEQVDVVAEEIGAETANEVGEKTLNVMKDAARLAQYHSQVSPDRHLVVVEITHDDNIRSLIQNQMGAGEAAHNYLPANTEMVDFKVANGKASTSFKGQNYSVEI